MSEKPNVILGLLRSRKFVTALLGVIITVLVRLFPVFGEAEQQILDTMLQLFSLAIGGWALEDAAQSFANRK